MEYLDWNDKLCRHFFSRTAGAPVFPCVSKNTLADVSGLDDATASSDFIAAVKQGPKWTQIPRCQNIASKAHNCLHPDPEWKEREEGDNREKLRLVGHVHWDQFEGRKLVYPPYFGYLCLLVVSYTERGDVHGGKFYEPLNQFLGLSGDEQLNCSDLGPKYEYNGIKLSINDLWKDLEHWSLSYEHGLFRLPDKKMWDQSYEYIPRYFGIFRAVDLRKLDRVFYALSERLIDDGRILRPEEILAKIIKLDIVKILSQDSIERLNGQDPAEKQAIGRLLISKYRQWDGITDEEDDGLVSRHCGARLLRFLQNGKMQAVVKLRSSKTLRRLPLEVGIEYETDSGSVLVWPGFDSEWFKPIDFDPANKMQEASLHCPDLRLDARMSARSLLVMTNQGLPAHLRGGYLEVEEIEAGLSYLVLTSSEEQPNPGVGEWSWDNGARVPFGFHSWQMRIPEAQNIDSWPDSLPQIIQGPSDPRPRICFGSPCRVEARKDIFLTRTPVDVFCRNADLSPYLCDQPKKSPRLEACETGWVLIADEPCSAEIGLRRSRGDEPVKGSIRKVEFISPEERIPPDAELLPLIQFDPQDLSPYPLGKVCLTSDGQITTRTNGDKVYLVDNPPYVEVEPHENNYQLIVRTDGKDSPIKQGRQIHKKRGKITLELRSNDIVLHAVRLELVQLPVVNIYNLSTNRDRPTNFPEALRTQIQCDEEYQVDYHIIGTNCNGHISAPMEGTLTLPREAGMTPNRTYEIRFSLAGVYMCSRWCKWVPPFRREGNGANRKAKPVKPEGLQGLRQIFDSVIKKKNREHF